MYHLPGIAQAELAGNGVRVTDRRIGTFTAADGVVYRVNGYPTATQLVANVDWNVPNQTWDSTGGSQYLFTMIHVGDQRVLYPGTPTWPRTRTKAAG